MVDTRNAPYHDDFSEEKGFYQVLFKPRTVQVRELNQLQSVFSNQIKQFGSHVFKEGSPVGHGGLSLNTEQEFVTASFPSSFNVASLVAFETGFELRSEQNGLRASVVAVKQLSSTQALFAINYINADSSAQRKFFLANDELLISSTVDISRIVLTDVRKGVLATSLGGYYFIGGRFVLADSQYISITDPSPTTFIGFKVQESIVDETQDESLFSNASGTPNYRAPGASRLKIKLDLMAVSVTDKPDNFVELIKIVDGVVQNKVIGAQYNALNDILAQRTYEESGDYTVTHFPVELIDHLREAKTPDGLFTADNGGSEGLFVTRLKKGVAYIRGYRSEIQGFVDIEVPKARTSLLVNNGVLPVSFGSYILVNTSTSPKIDFTRRHSLLSASNAVIGSAVIRSVKFESSNTLRIYLMDTTFTAGSMSDVKTITGNFGAGDNFTGSLVESIVFDATKDSLVFKLPYDTVKTVTGAGGQDVTFSAVRTYDLTLDGSGLATIAIAGSDILAPVDPYNFAVVNMTDNQRLSNSGLSIGGSPVGKVLSLNYPGNAGDRIRVTAVVVKPNPTFKTKTKRTHTENIVFSNQKVKKLTYADVLKINRVKDLTTNAVITDRFSFFSGQRSNWYENGELISPTNLTGGFEVEYEYLEHSNSGDFFVIDSYAGFDKRDIPSTRDISERVLVSLSDCIDFRPLRLSNGSFNVSEVIQPNDSLRFDLEVYLPRIDVVYASQDGSFAVEQGVPATIPKTPKIPEDSLGLYELYVPAFTDTAERIRIKKLDNRRYTMKDIGKLDERLRNVEYFTSLSLLEQKTDRIQVLDPVTGSNRFKNGFTADNFKGTTLLDIYDPEWKASIDSENGIVHPFIRTHGLNAEYVSGGQQGQSTATLPYVIQEVMNQPFKTNFINVNPFGVFTWTGSVLLSPRSDFWRDTLYNPAIVLDKTNDLTGGRTAGTVFNGTETSELFWWQGNSEFRTVNTTQNFTTTEIQETVSVTSIDRSAAINVIPFMRPIQIKFELKNFKPFARLYAFFSGINVSSRCGLLGNAQGTPITCDEKGYAQGFYNVPASETFRFRNGVNVLRFTDAPNDERSNDILTTSGESNFNSGGSEDVRQVTFTRTTNINAVETRWAEQSSATNFIRQRDPIAQTFILNNRGGNFIHSVDVYFRTKSPTIPVTLQLRTVENGVPTSNVVSFGEVVLDPNQVNASLDGSVHTRFPFSDLVYLQEGIEYAIVLLSDSQDYEAFISRIGETDLVQQVSVAKQPNTGVFLVSANGTTWTANQTDDLSFRINAAKFTTAASTVRVKAVNFENIRLELNPFSTTAGLPVIRIATVGHGLKVGDFLTITGAVPGNGVSSALINATHRVEVSNLSWVEIAVGVNATTSSTFGGASVLLSGKKAFSNILVTTERLVLNGTTLTASVNYPTQLNRGVRRTDVLALDIATQATAQGVSSGSDDMFVDYQLSTDNQWISPIIDISSIGMILTEKQVKENETLFSVVTKSIKFDNPSTLAKIFLGCFNPVGNNLKVFFKLIENPDEDLRGKAWIEAVSDTPVVNSSESELEYSFTVGNSGLPFIGYKLKITVDGIDSTKSSYLKDLRTIGLA